MALCVASALGQVNQQSSGNNSPKAGNGDLVVKSSPAADALVELSEKMKSTQKAYNDLLQQARTNLDTLNKPLIAEMTARAKKWQDKIDAENKDLKAKIDKNTADAQGKFQKETAALTQNSVSPQTLAALEEVVKKEQNLPATAHYDADQKKWVDTAKK
jgi:exonuclease VII large subunit